MPRKRSENTEAINLRIPMAWIKMADKLAQTGGTFAEVTRTAVLRAALGEGLETFARKYRRGKP